MAAVEATAGTRSRARQARRRATGDERERAILETAESLLAERAFTRSRSTTSPAAPASRGRRSTSTSPRRRPCCSRCSTVSSRRRARSRRARSSARRRPARAPAGGHHGIYEIFRAHRAVMMAAADARATQPRGARGVGGGDGGLRRRRRRRSSTPSGRAAPRRRRPRARPRDRAQPHERAGPARDVRGPRAGDRRGRRRRSARRGVVRRDLRQAVPAGSDTRQVFTSSDRGITLHDAEAKRADCAGAGIRREKHGRGFRYDDEAGDRLTTRRRWSATPAAIPPAWREVWICPDPHGHIQATASTTRAASSTSTTTQAREKQDPRKYEQMLELADQLPSLRRSVKRRLGARGFTRDRVSPAPCACSTSASSDRGASSTPAENESFGLATLSKSHVRSENGAVIFDYPAKKAGSAASKKIADPQLVKLVRALKRRRGGGHELLAYREGRRWVNVRSDEVNAYLKELERAPGTPPRTSNLERDRARPRPARAEGATMRRRRPPAGGSRAGRQGGSRGCSETLRPSARAYIDPRVFDRFDSGATIEPALRDGISTSSTSCASGSASGSSGGRGAAKLTHRRLRPGPRGRPLKPERHSTKEAGMARTTGHP